MKRGWSVLPVTKRAVTLTIAGIWAGLLVCSSSAATQVPASRRPSGRAGAASPTYAPLVIEDVTVIDVRDGRRLPRQTVVVSNRRIQALGRSTMLRRPAGARVVNGRGKYLIPGLWDMHTHSNELDTWYPLLLANGITGIRDVGAYQLGVDTLRWLRGEIAAGRRIGPRQPTILGQMLSDGEEERWKTPAGARYLIDSTQAAGAEMFKFHFARVSREAYFALLAEARRVGLPVVGHLPPHITVVEASDSGLRSIEHINWLVNNSQLPCSGDNTMGECVPRGNWLGLCNGPTATMETCSALAQHLRRNGTWFTPTLVYQYYPAARWSHRPIISQQPYLDSAERHVVPYEREAFSEGGPPFSKDSAYSAILSLMAQAGMPVLTGTDGGGIGYATVHEELALLVEKGFSPLAALQAATLNPAQYFGATDSLGTIAPGQLADLVLLDADPLVDIRHTVQIRAVVANGRYFDRPALDRLLAEVRRRVRAGRAR